MTGKPCSSDLILRASVPRVDRLAWSAPCSLRTCWWPWVSTRELLLQQFAFPLEPILQSLISNIACAHSKLWSSARLNLSLPDETNARCAQLRKICSSSPAPTARGQERQPAATEESAQPARYSSRKALPPTCCGWQVCPDLKVTVEWNSRLRTTAGLACWRTQDDLAQSKTDRSLTGRGPTNTSP